MKMNSKKSPTNIQRMCIPLERLDSSGSRFKFPILGHCCPGMGNLRGGGGARLRNDRPMSLLFIGIVPRLRFFSMLSVFLKI